MSTVVSELFKVGDCVAFDLDLVDVSSQQIRVGKVVSVVSEYAIVVECFRASYTINVTCGLYRLTKLTPEEFDYCVNHPVLTGTQS